MQHALYLPPFGTFGDVHTIVDLAQRAERAGWDGFFLWDHVLYDQPVPLVDAWLSLAAVATGTERIRLGPLVTPLPRRRAWKVAREAVTLDHLSGGRLVLGVGLGIDFWREFSAFDEPATDDRQRAALLDDGIEVLRRLWSGEPVDFTGQRLRIDGAQFLPTPAQPGGIPIWSAAIWPPNPGPLRRAARCEGIMPFSPGPPITPEDVVGLRSRLTELRDGDGTFDVCLHGPPERAADYAAAGVTWLCLSFGPDEPLAEVHRRVDDGPPR